MECLCNHLHYYYYYYYLEMIDIDFDFDFDFGALQLEGPKIPCFPWEIHSYYCSDHRPKMAASNHYLPSCRNWKWKGKGRKDLEDPRRASLAAFRSNILKCCWLRTPALCCGGLYPSQEAAYMLLLQQACRLRMLIPPEIPNKAPEPRRF